MTGFTLTKKSANNVKTTFHVLNGAGDICGSINVQNAEVPDLLRHWVVPPHQTTNQAGSVVNAKPRNECPTWADVTASDLEEVAEVVMSSSGIGAMGRAGVWCENMLGTEVLLIGRSADNTTENCVMEICGRWLVYRIALRGGWIWLSAQLMDKGDSPEAL